MPMSYNRLDLSNAALKAWQNAHPELMPASDEPLPIPRLNRDYDTQEITTMTTPSALSPAEQFRAKFANSD